MGRIYLSPPHMGGDELGLIEEAFTTNWLSTVGPHLQAFEQEMEAYLGRPCVALSSGTAAIHLGLRLLGVGPGDEVICPTLTFVASCNPIRYLGGRPVFVDAERATWNLDPQRLEELLRDRAAKNRLPAALVVVHIYGQPANMDAIAEVCARYDIPMLEDAAEALGASYRERKAATLCPVAALSFNGNKIITTSGGGMLVAEDPAWVDRARFWSTQARDPGISYEHSELGYNYRLSNILAGVGRGQLRVLDTRVQQRRAIAFRYRDAFADTTHLELMPQSPDGHHTNWLSVFLCSTEPLRDALISALAAADIEARPVWKPMHLQPLYADFPCYGGEVAQDLFRRGVCLPSGTQMSSTDQERVIDIVRSVVANHPTGGR